MNRYLAVTLAVLMLLMGAYVKGQADGRAALHAAASADQIASQAAQIKAEAAAQSRRRGALKLEDAANADPVTAAACLPADRVRRLSLR